MTIDELIAEGESLVRPCFLLTGTGSGRLGGYWGGERLDKPTALPPTATQLKSLRHIITIDQTLLGELGLPGARSAAPLSLFEAIDVFDWESHRLEREPSPSFSEISCTGEPLYAVPAKSFPPFEAVCLYGSARVEEWLRSQGKARHQYDSAFSSPVVRDYMDEFTDRAPMYSGEADAIIGGWHMCWPEDDFFMPLETRLVLTTIRDSEPFYEIWVARAVNNFSVKSRIA